MSPFEMLDSLFQDEDKYPLIYFNNSSDYENVFTISNYK